MAIEPGTGQRIREPYDIIDDRFARIAMSNVDLHQLDTGSHWAEGPVWFSDGNFLLWSDIPNNRMMRWIPDVGTSVFRSPANNSNGHTRDRQGRLVSCEHLTRRVTRTEPDGSITVLADRYEGRRLNSPNDVVVRSDGSIYFTDPTYGILSDYEGDRTEPEQPHRGVYRIDASSGRVTLLVDDFNQPNGLAFSADESVLYIADSGASHDGTLPRHIRAFDIDAAGTLSRDRVFCLIDQGIPDGIRCDTQGRLWSSAKDGVHCFSSDGEILGKILVPETVANLCFGGLKKNRLFVAATRSIYSIMVNARGA